ncbi:MAG: AI-2E family transporter [Marinifilaceae bacterium]|jgi:predicted PurR-regulated permease PerM|nr:AI-2E family transporter [Marinifilaceae bacterium]
MRAKYFFIAFLVVLLGFVCWYFSNILAYIIISLILSLIGRPIVEFISKFKIRNKQIPISLSAVSSLLVLWFVMVMFFRIFIPLLAAQAEELSTIEINTVVESLEQPIDKINNLANKYLKDSDFDIKTTITENITSFIKVSDISNIFKGIAGTLGNVFMALFSISFITFFLLKDNSMFSELIIVVFPEKYDHKLRHIFKSIKGLLTRYFIGLVIEMSLVGFLITMGLWLVGIKFSTAMVIGLLGGLMNIIPYIGPLIGATLGMIIGIITNIHTDFYSDILPLMGYMAIVFGSVQIIDNVFFQPLIYSNSVNAHPLEIFLVIVIAGSMMGIIGMMAAIPMYTILRVVAKEFFNDSRLVGRITKNI